MLQYLMMRLRHGACLSVLPVPSFDRRPKFFCGEVKCFNRSGWGRKIDLNREGKGADWMNTMVIYDSLYGNIALAMPRPKYRLAWRKRAVR